MKKLMTIVAFVAMTATTAGAYTPNQDVTFLEFVQAAGCVVIDKGGYLTFDGGCAAASEFTPIGSILVDTDNDPLTPDVPVRDN